MGRIARNISFTKKEYEAVKAAGIKSLTTKMEAAMQPVEKEVMGFTIRDAMSIASQIMGDKVKFAPIMAGGWYSKMNNKIKSDGITAEHVSEAATIANTDWKAPIFFDQFFYSIGKLIAIGPRESRGVREFRGFAEDSNLREELDEKYSYPG